MDSTSQKRKQDDTSSASGKRPKLINDFFRKPGTSDSASTSPEIPLEDLLDFTVLTTQEEVSDRFDALAKALLHDYRIVVINGETETEFMILELEFYLQKAGFHEDPFTHGSEEQKISGRWYFHRAPEFSADGHRNSTSATVYRDGSRKGVDLTIGRKMVVTAENENSANPRLPGSEPLLRGGILLRSIRQVGNNKITSGPSLLVDQILQHSGATGIPDLVQNKWKGDISAFPSGEKESNREVSLILRHTRKGSPTIYRSPRIGLELSHPGVKLTPNRPLHPRIIFLPRLYRYFVHPDQLTTKGRAQSFVGVLHRRLESHRDVDAKLKDPRLHKEIGAIMALKDGTAAKYLADYVGGWNSGMEALELFIGPKGKGASSSPNTYLKMMGAVNRVCAAKAKEGGSGDVHT